MKKFTWKETKRKYWDKGVFDTVEECVEEAKGQGYTGDIHVANVELYKPCIYADDILEDIEDGIYEIYGEEFEFKKDETVNELSKRLTEVLLKWLNETNQNLNCYDIVGSTAKVYKV